MKKVLMFVVLLASCSAPGTRSETYVMPLDNVQQGAKNVLEVPVILRVGDELKVRVSVAFGGCETFQNFESKRTADRLELTPIGSRQLDVACTTIYGTKWVDFTDAAAPARSSLFTVSVRRGNGANVEQVVAVTP
jgi:hypothetical protein